MSHKYTATSIQLEVNKSSQRALSLHAKTSGLDLQLLMNLRFVKSHVTKTLSRSNPRYALTSEPTKLLLLNS